MPAMVKQWVFSGSGIGVSLWRGNTGDILRNFQPEACSRSDAPFITAGVRGSAERTEALDGVVMMMHPGDTTDGLPDILVGWTTWTVREDGTVFICAGAIGENDAPMWAPMQKVVLQAGELDLQVGRVLIVATGSCEVDGQQYAAPHLVHAKDAPAHVSLIGGVGVEVWR